MPEVKGLPAAADLAKNPLSETHEFRQACSSCFVKTGERVSLLSGSGPADGTGRWFQVEGDGSVITGPGVLEYVLHTEEHKCKKDALLGRIKVSADQSWKLIRPRPTKTQYVGPYYICKGTGAPLPPPRCFLPVPERTLSFQRWLWGKSVCIRATARLRTARRRSTSGLWSGRASSPGSSSSTPTGTTPTPG